MAEGIARKILGPNVDVASAGTHAHIRDPPAANAVKVLNDKFGVDISKHRSQSVNDVHIETFNYLVPLADIVLDDLKAYFPGLERRMLSSWNIDDPYGGDLYTYEVTAARLQEHMQGLALFLKKETQ